MVIIKHNNLCLDLEHTVKIKVMLIGVIEVFAILEQDRSDFLSSLIFSIVEDITDKISVKSAYDILLERVSKFKWGYFSRRKKDEIELQWTRSWDICCELCNEKGPQNIDFKDVIEIVINDDIYTLHLSKKKREPLSLRTLAAFEIGYNVKCEKDLLDLEIPKTLFDKLKEIYNLIDSKCYVLQNF